MKENSQSLLLIYAFGQKASCSQSEFPPYMLKHHIAVVSRGLQREDMSVDETEIAQETSQLRPHPHGPYPSVVVFENVPAGTYRTETYLTEGKTFAAYGGEGQTDLNAYQFSTEGSQASGEFTVSAGMETEQGIGVETAYHVAGFCWVETNVDGVYESGEPMMPNVRITLDGQKNGLHYETISKADGTWIIDRVRPALYTLTVYTPDGLTFTRQANSGKYRTVISRDGVFKASKAVDLNDKTSRESQNIGFTRASIVKGICYLDANYNGFYDEGEQPLQGV